LNCRRSEELWTDYLEGTLAPPLETELSKHLSTCESCRELFSAFEQVVAGLHALEAPSEPEGLLERVLARTRPSMIPIRSSVDATVRSARFRPVPSGWARALGGLAAAVLALVMIWRPPEALSEWSTAVSRSAHQAYGFGVRTVHQAGRFIEDLDLLRMTVGVAFEDRLDELNERLRDLEQAGRDTDDEEDPSSSQGKSKKTSSPPSEHARLRRRHSETRSLL